MSFGFSIGDIIAVSSLARTVWGRFRDASDQFNAIQSEAAGLHLALDDIAQSLSGVEVTEKQAKDLLVLVKGCRDVLGDAERYIQKNESLGTDSSSLGFKTQKTWRKLKWDPTIVNQLRDRMVANTSYLNTFNNSLTSQVFRATNDTVKTIAEDVQGLRLSQSQQKREEILQWISTLNFTPQQSDLSARRQEGTGLWLLKSADFQRWKSTEGLTLTCQGIPGAGKTMLTSLVVDDLRRSSNSKDVATAYIYCDYRREEEQTPINLLSSITKQLLDHQVAIPESILNIYQHHSSKKTRPTLEELSEMIQSAMSPLSKTYLVLDALDELGNAGQVRQDLLERLRKLQCAHPFNLMTTSRYIPSLAQDFDQPLCMEIRADPEDIRKYVQGHISDLANCVRKDIRLQETIANSITDVVEGMFLLAALHVDSLRDKTSAKMITKALERLPKGSEALNLAYDGAIQRLENQREGFRSIAKQLLGWLTYSKRLMTVKEVQNALAIEPGTPNLDKDNLSDIDEIIGFCAGLVIVDEETQFIRLVHYTTQDYLRTNGNRLLASAQQDIAIGCLTYLLYDRFGDGWTTVGDPEEDESGEVEEDEPEEVEEDESEDVEEDESEEAVISLMGLERSLRSVRHRLQKYPLLGYAVSYWADHARVCGQQNMKDLMMSFAKDDRKISSASQVMLILDSRHNISGDTDDITDFFDDTKSPNPLSAMHLFAYIGHEDLILELLNHGYKADAKDACQNTPLWWAARQGHHAAAKLLLLQSHVNVNNRGSNRHKYGDVSNSGTTPLGEAARLGKDKIVELLISCADVDVNLRRNSDGNTPLHSAAFFGRRDIVKILLKRKDIQVNATNDNGQSPLAIAAESGTEGSVKLLLGHTDIKVNLRDASGHTAILRAAARDKDAVANLLLSRTDLDVNCRCDSGKTVLHYAAKGGGAFMLRLMMTRTMFDVNTKDKDGQTPLHYAASWGPEESVRTLLNHVGIEVNSKDKDSRTPLHRAAGWGSEVSLRMLLEHVGIKVNSKDKDGRTPLHCAAVWGFEEPVRTLLEHVGIEVNSKDNHGETPFAMAMIRGYRAVVKLLCAHPGVYLYPTDNEGRDVFALVAERQQEISRRLKRSHASNYIQYIQQESLDLEESLKILRTTIAERGQEQCLIPQAEP